MKGSSTLQKLKVILWKNFIIRKRHWFVTLLEILIPAVLFALFSYGRAKIDGMASIYVNESTYCRILEEEEVYSYIHSSLKIYYAPKTEFTSELMYSAQVKLNRNIRDVRGFKNFDELVDDFMKDEKNPDVVAVEFHNLNSTLNEQGFPKKLDFSIRPFLSYLPWGMTQLFDEQLFYEPDQGSRSYLNQGFMALQLAIDTSFINLMTKKNMPYKFSMQEFPYPPYYNNSALQTIFMYVLPLLVIFSFVFLCSSVIKRIVEEKNTGIKELMKMKGLKPWMLWTGWFLHAFFVNFISILIIVFLMKVPLFGSDYSAIEHCSWSILTVFLLLYCATGIVFCFAISSMFNRPTIAMVFGTLVWILSYSILFSLVDDSPNLKLSWKLLSSLFPNMAVALGFQVISTYESRGIGSTWSNLFKSATEGKNDMSLGLVFVMFIVDIILYMLITVYLENIKPGPYGISKPFNYPFLYIRDLILKKIDKQTKTQAEKNCMKDYCKIETVANMKAGVQIKNLCKSFDDFKAVDKFSIDIYEGQITALLGHNGAGKTTTMSIITGMIEATSGQVLINDKDINFTMNDIQGILGFCPQHNMQFTDLTLIEHLIFFGMLKGLTHFAAEKESESLLRKFNLMTKKNEMATKLSGGMRRKLSLGMALIGNSKVLILDEPTSGLDVEARREIWDILQNERGSRTIIISTHFMEEADILGDRIAIMDHGRLICYGTSMYLKKEYGTGYYLSLTKEEDAVFNEVEINKIVSRYIENPSYDIKGYRLTYVLPHDTKSSFGNLLKDLELNKDELKITNINLNVTTLEEVFLKVGDLVSDLGDKTDSSNIPWRKYESSHSRISMQMNKLFNTRYLVFKTNWNFHFIQLLIAFLLVFVTLYLSSPHVSFSEKIPAFELLLSKYGDTIVYEGIPPTTDISLTNIQKKYSQVVKSQDSQIIPVDDVSEAIIQKGIDNIAVYNRYMVVAAEFNQTLNGDSIRAMYSSKALHGAPISVNLLMNAAIKSLTGDDQYSIATTNHPLPHFNKDEFTGQAIDAIQVSLLWLLTFPLALLFYTAIFVSYPQMENSTNVRHLQLMCNLRSFFYWCNCYVFDFILYLALLCLIMFTVYLFGIISTTPFADSSELSTLCLILLVYGLCVIPYSYLYSHKKTSAGAFAAYLIINLILSIFMTIVVLVALVLDDQNNTNVGEGLKTLFLFFPQFGLCFTSWQFSKKVSENYNFNIMNENQRKSYCHFRFNHPCCGEKNNQNCQKYQSYLGFENNGISLNLIIMAVSIFIYFVLICFLDSTSAKKLLAKINSLKAKLFCQYPKSAPREDKEEPDGLVSMNEDNKDNKEQDELWVHGLTKDYGDQRVVDKINFKVKGGTFYGLLGVNGAGKTTTFRMLTGNEVPSEGDAEITQSEKKFGISKNLVGYLDRLGYCPQFDAINPKLTGEQMMTLFAYLRGMDKNDIEHEVNNLINTLGLEEYKNKECGKYSGGNKRKLSVGLALIGYQMLIMLDEPTSGVDPVSRRKLWDVFQEIRELQNSPSIILTSHSMDECESLCDRISIMKNGKIVTQDTLPRLKEKHCQGYSVKIKLTMTPPLLIQTVLNEDSSSETPLANCKGDSDSLPGDTLKNNPIIANIKEDFENRFLNIWKLRDEHTNLLHYHITDKTKRLSELFIEMEDLKEKFSTFIEDYHISETTLEEIFLSIARDKS